MAHGASVRVALINQSEADSKALPLLATVLTQFMAMFAADTDETPTEVIVAPNNIAPPGFIEALILQTPDVDGALAYHDRDDKGNPRIKSFYGLIPGGEIFHDPSGGLASLNAELQHEIAETKRDPFANRYVDLAIKDPQGSGKIYKSVADEDEDPVQESGDSFDVEGTKCDRTNYVLPVWFDQDAPKGTIVDRLNMLSGPATVAAGGYVIVREAYTQDDQIFARCIKLEHHSPMMAWRAKKKALPHSRTARRLAQVVQL